MTEAPVKNLSWIERAILGSVCALVIGVYAYTANSGQFESVSLHAADNDYNSLVQAFRAGQLNLKKAVPAGFTQLPDPYNPDANALYRSVSYGLHDLTYYKGRLYLDFGAMPVLILLWPCAAITGHYPFHRQAVVIFCVIGFLAGVFLLHAVWRRYFAAVKVWVVVAGARALANRGSGQ